ncbi:MAG: amino acid ABC transporter permease [Alteromonadaceae bacterium]|nr:amino acid ABC transporter permease [Alteromonadaceae bacterium]
MPARDRRIEIFGAVVLVLVLAAIASIASNENFRWTVVGDFMFHSSILTGIRNTLLLTAISMIVGSLIGAVIALMKISQSRALNAIAEGYVWLFRGIPLLVQLLIWFNLAALYPRLGIGIPGSEIGFFVNANEIISPFSAAILALTLHESALMAEVIRSGLLSVNRGQTEAAQALAMPPRKVMIRIVLPQAMRVIVPPTGNQAITMLKTTSLVSFIALNDLTYSAQIIYSQNYQVIPLLMVASIWYLVMVTILSYVQNRVEWFYGKGYANSK